MDPMPNPLISDSGFGLDLYFGEDVDIGGGCGSGEADKESCPRGGLEAVEGAGGCSRMLGLGLRGRRRNESVL